MLARSGCSSSCTPSLPTDFPPLRSLDALPNNLPLQVTSFIGREKQITEARALLAKAPLLTITGSGGVGKTRLALQVAAEELDRYPEGVWLAELAPLDPGLVPQAVATALNVREQGARPLTQTLIEHLKPRALLLVLDNCEHLLSAAAQLAEALLRACPGVRVLASSREGLGIAGEVTYRVPSLSVPDPRHLPPVDALGQFEAVRLFIERAMAALPSFSVTNANAPAVAQVCYRLDGIPLAIEPGRGAGQGARGGADRPKAGRPLPSADGRQPHGAPRQQTLRAAIDWSYDLLPAAEKLLLSRLSVFAGGWTLEAAEAVCSGAASTTGRCWTC